MNSIRRISKWIALARWDDPPRFLIDRFVSRMAEELGKQSWVLDAGAGESVYRPAFSHCNYVSCDLATGDASWDYKHLTVIADMAGLPFQENTFDAVLCTQVLEHVCYPHLAIREMARLLKPEGRLYLSVPFLGDPLHQEPHDFYRFTKYGLTSLLEGASLAPVRVAPIGGLLFLFCCYLWWLSVIYRTSALPGGRTRVPGTRLLKMISRTAILFTARLCTMLVIRLGGTDYLSGKFTYGYTVIAAHHNGQNDLPNQVRVTT